MYFDDTNGQWISVGKDVLIFGEKLKDNVIALGKDIIPAGTVMVFAQSKVYLMFQTLQDLDLNSTRNSTLIDYEKGSIIFQEGDGWFPLLRFRECRFPTEMELKRYERKTIV